MPEYWDRAGIKGLTLAFKAATAVAKGGCFSWEGWNAKVDL